MTTTILYAKPVCYEHLHPSASGKLAQERRNRKSSTQADELQLSLDPASLCHTASDSPLEPTIPLNTPEVPATIAEIPPSLGTITSCHDIPSDSCVESDFGIRPTPLSPPLAQRSNIHPSLADQLVDPGVLELDALLSPLYPFCTKFW